MKTIHVQNDTLSVNQLLSAAAGESVLLVSKDGKTFVLEEADEFEREVAELGQSERFMTFLQERAREQAGTPLDEIAGRLGAKKA